jgi:ribonuclease R
MPMRKGVVQAAMDRKNNIKHLSNDLEKLMSSSRQTELTSNQILEGLNLSLEDKPILLNLIKNMHDNGLLIKTEQGRYGLPEKLGMATGVLRANRRGFAFLLPDQPIDDIYINPENLNNAVHGDRVIVRLDQKKGRRKREGTVLTILKRGQNRLLGTLHREHKRYFVVPDDDRFLKTVQVAAADLKQAQPGDKVVVEIDKWAKGNRPSRGIIAERLGRPGSPQTEKLTFKYRFDLPGEFPPAVNKVLEILPGEKLISQAVDEEGRADLRSLKMVTIDDQSARDFDDAVSLELLENGSYRLGVHIADVSHYVKQGTALDREAFKRGTSIYLVERVIHMLPPLLSENLCSLQAGKDRLAVSVLMDIDRQGELLSAHYTPSVIRVTERLTYQQVEAHFKRQEEDPFQDGSLAELLDQMKELAGILRVQRMQRGSLDLDLPEAKIEIDENGKPLAIIKREMGQSESLIEEFMIYCNESVAGYLEQRKLPCIYRIHTLPTLEKMSTLRETLSMMGIKALARQKVLKPKHLKDLLEQTRGEQTERLVRYLVLRSLPQAQYSAVNEGHFGLASTCYCHFTSPIRRYPDLVVHRFLKQQLKLGGLTGEKIRKMRVRLPEVAMHCSERERAAVEAERASTEMKKAEYMEQKIGEVFSGIINGVTNFGLFVELDNTVEGLIPIVALKDDYYFYNEKAASLTGERTRKSYRLGDLIDIVVKGVDREEGKVSFAPAESLEQEQS